MDDKIKDVHIWIEFLNEHDKITEKKVDVLEEFDGFDKKPEISYTITGQQPFKNKAGEYWTEEVKVYTFDEAIEKAKIFSKKYHDKQNEAFWAVHTVTGIPYDVLYNAVRIERNYEKKHNYENCLFHGDDVWEEEKREKNV